MFFGKMFIVSVWPKKRLVLVQQCVGQFNENIGYAKTKMTGDYGWWNNGYMPGKIYETINQAEKDYENSKEKALNEGGQEEYSCADFLFYCGHGRENYHEPPDSCMLIPCRDVGDYAGVLWKPDNVDAGSSWEEDVEFCIFDGCEILGTSAAPDLAVDEWIENLFEKGIHAVLATSDEVFCAALDNDFYYFIEALKSGQRVVDAWKAACYVGWDTPYGIIVRESNLDDRLSTPIATTQVLTRDSKDINTTFIYYWHQENEKQIEWPPNAGKQTTDTKESAQATLSEMVDFTDEVEVSTWKVSKRKATRLSEMKDIADHFDDSSCSEESLRAWNNAPHARSWEHKQTSETKPKEVKNWLASKGVTIPNDYEFFSHGSMMAQQLRCYKGRHWEKEREWCEGQTFTFLRHIESKPVMNDTCSVMIRGEQILSLHLVYHDLEKIGSFKMKKPRLLQKDGQLGEDGASLDLIYFVKKKRVDPVWKVRLGNDIFLFDALTGEPYER